MLETISRQHPLVWNRQGEMVALSGSSQHVQRAASPLSSTPTSARLRARQPIRCTHPTAMGAYSKCSQRTPPPQREGGQPLFKHSLYRLPGDRL